jgi:RNA polymerase sigma-70 factor (ECF subfamily)
MNAANARAVADPSLLRQAAEELRAPLTRRLALIVGDAAEAEDLAQATFTRALEAWSSFGGGDLRAWLYTIGIRLALSEVRRRKRGPTRLRVLQHDRPVEPTSELELWEALRELDRSSRAALLMNVVDGYTQAEIAELLGVPPGTVASWISRTKAHLRRRLTEATDG